jgi:hypothetical protein
MRRLKITPLLLHAACIAWLAGSASMAYGMGAAAPPTLATAQQKLAAMSVPFVPNAGQWDSRAAFATQTFAGTLFVTTDGALVYSLPGKLIDVGADLAALGNRATPSRRLQPTVGADSAALGRATVGADSAALVRATVGADLAALPGREPSDAKSSPTSRTPGWALTETLVDAKGQPRSMRQSTLKAPAGYRPMEGKVSYATTQHTENLNTYERVNLGDMYPGINVQLRATHTKAGGNVEKIFTVAPKYDPKQIQIKLAGAQKLEINGKGELIAHTGNGPVAFTAPIAFQENDQGERVTVDVAYQLVGADLAALPGAPPSDAKSSPTTTYTFTLGDYDTTRPLVIDPLLASTYLGGGGYDQINAIAVHPHTGQVYVAGETDSLSFPQSGNGAQTSASGNSCFVSRYSADLQQLLQSTYLGDGNVRCRAMAIHPGNGAVYVAGSAGGTSTFPSGSMTSAIQTIHADANNPTATDGFVALLSADLRTLTKATFFGGATGLGSEEQINAIAVHPHTGFVHIAGETASGTLPGIAVGTQTTPRGSGDAFTARLPADLVVSMVNPALYTFLGGNDLDKGNALAIDPRSGDVFVAGATGGGLPAAMFSGATPIPYAGSGDAFVARLKQDLSTVVRATYLGGTGYDEARSIAMHPLTGEVVVAGITLSSNLPQSLGGAQPNFGGGLSDGFVGRLSADLTAILQTTYLGGMGNDCEIRCQVAIHPLTGEVFVAGDTSGNLPAALVADGYQSVYGLGSNDAFIVRLNAALTARRAGTYLGGSGREYPSAIAIEPNGGSVYVAGYHNGGGFPTMNPQQSLYGGGIDGFISRLSTDLTAVNRTPSPFSFIHQSNVPVNTWRTSNEVQVSGLTASAEAYLSTSNAPVALVCASTLPGCCAAVDAGSPPASCTSVPNFLSGWTTTMTLSNGLYVSVKHFGPLVSGSAETKLIAGGASFPFRTSTGNAAINCNLDMNADNKLDATREGLILVRAMLGFSSAAVVAGTDVTQGAWNSMRPQINANCGTNF